MKYFHVGGAVMYTSERVWRNGGIEYTYAYGGCVEFLNDF